MIALTEPQTWTIIGVLSATLVGFMTFGLNSINRTIGAKIDGLRAEMNARFEAVDARFDAVNSRFDAVNTRLDGLDRDVQTLMDDAFKRRRDE